MSILSDTMRMGASQPSADAYQIEKSLRFNDDDTPSLSRTLSLGNRRTHTIAMWIKIGEAGNEGYLFSAPNTSRIKLETDGTMKWEIGSSQRRITNQVFRDHAAWQHHVFALDTPNADAASRARWYVNGKEITSFATADTITQNFESIFNSAGSHRIGANASNANNWDGYIADVQFIDGLALSPTEFGSFDDAGNWNPKEPDTRNNPNNGTTWSSHVSGSAYSGSYPASQAFNGTIGGNPALAASTQTFAPTGGITVNTSLRIYQKKNGSGNTFTVNGTDYSGSTTEPGSWLTIPNVTTLTSVVWGTSGYNDVSVSAIEVDGYILIDGAGDNSFHLKFNNASDLGEDSLNSNDFTVNNLLAADVDVLEIPSSEVTGTSLRNNMFDGSLSTQVSGADGSRVYWTPGSNITINTNGLKAYWSATYDGYKSGIESDDGTNQIITISSSGNANTWVTFSSYNGETIGPSNKLMFRSYRSNDSDPGVLGFKAIEVNGKIVSINPGDKADVFNDTPTNFEDSGTVHGNFCTLNPLKNGGLTLSQGNLQQTLSSGATWKTAGGTFGVSSGKWYFEYEVLAGPGSPDDHIVGWAKEDFTTLSGDLWTDTAHSYSSNGWYRYNTGSNIVSLNSYTVGDCIGVAADFTSGNLYFYKNGTAENSGNAVNTTSMTGLHYPIVANWSNGTTCTGSLNFGQRAFKYTNAGTNRPAADYKSLCTQNLDDFATDNNPSKYFDVLTWTGDGSASRAITGLSFQPDLSWLKRRNSALDHFIWDAVRGVTKELYTNQNYAEGTATNKLASFDSGGITVKDNSAVNADGDTYVGWFWDAGTSAATASTAGGITPSAQWVNATAGFSMSKYTGTGSATTVGTGLSAAAEFYIVKRTNDTGHWNVASTAIGIGYDGVILNLTSDKGSNSSSTSYWNNTAPTSTVVSIGTADNVNKSGDTFMMYCWTSIPGFSSFGVYDGSSSEKFIYTGFQPRWIMVKLHSETLSSGGWKIIDTARDPFNDGAVKSKLAANEAEAENGNTTIANNEGDVDILSNGFRITDNHAPWNTNGRSYLYAAFAEHPFKTSRAQ